MKNYLDFNLTGRKFLPLWLLFFALFLMPYVTVILGMNHHPAGTSPSPLYLLWLLLLIVDALIILYFLAWAIIENVVYRDKPLVFNGSFGKFAGIAVGGFLLTIITLGIYSPWFIRNLYRFFVNHSSWNDHPFSFLGKGGNLFLIITLTFILPVVVLTVWLIKFSGVELTQQSVSLRIGYRIVLFILLIPYFYLIYRWSVNFKYGEFVIRWNTRFLPSIGKIALEILLTIITVGIYFPMAFLRLYNYFSAKTETNVFDHKMFRFGFEPDYLNDFLLIWGQVLLTIVTLGIYYPWALCKITGRILRKTYVEKLEMPIA